MNCSSIPDYTHTLDLVVALGGIPSAFFFLKSKQGKSFDAVVAFDGEYNTTFVFPEAKKGKKFSGRKK